MLNNNDRKESVPCIVLCTNSIGDWLFGDVFGSDVEGDLRRDLEASLAELVQPGVADRAVWDLDHAKVLGWTVAVHRSPFVAVAKTETLIVFFC